MDLDQDSEVEFVGQTEPGYNAVRSGRVEYLLTYFFPPKVRPLNFIFISYYIMYVADSSFIPVGSALQVLVLS